MTSGDPAAPPLPGDTRLDAAGVACIYKALLGRNPGRDEIEWQLQATSSWPLLLEAVTASDEYRARKPGAPTAMPQARVNIWREDLAEHTHRVGTRSDDGEAIVGNDGWLFLVGGTNSVLSQYQSDFTVPSDWAEQWTGAVAVRRDEARAVGADLAMVVVPDKLSVLGQALPGSIELHREPPAADLAGQLGLNVLYPVSELRGLVEGSYLRTDTHLSLAGNAELAKTVLSQIPGAPWTPDLSGTPTSRFVTSGDLGRRFTPAIVEVATAVSSMGAAEITEDNRSQVEAVGKHLGTRRVLKNASAADSRTVVVFGDSYAFPTPHYQGLAWFLGQHFREVHFIWSPFGWDRAYVERCGAQVVVCETAERFVPRPPSPRFDVDALIAATIPEI